MAHLKTVGLVAAVIFVNHVLGNPLLTFAQKVNANAK